MVWPGMSNFQVNGAMYAGSVDTVSGDFAVLGVRPVLGRVLTIDLSKGRIPSFLMAAAFQGTRCRQRKAES